MDDIREVQKIYDRIPDRQSRMIYSNRMNYSLTGDRHFLAEIVDRTVRSKTEWNEFCKDLMQKAAEDNMVIFGAGIWGNILYNETNTFLQWKCMIDSHPKCKKNGDLPVIPFGEFIENYEGEYIVISSYKNYQDMKKQLCMYNVPDDRIIDAGKVIYQLTEKDMYFDLQELLPCRELEVFVDAGCFDGATTRRFFEWCNGEGYSYCLEPDAQNIVSIKKKSEDNKKLEIIDKALWSRTTTLSINANGNYATSVAELTDHDNSQRVEAIALDDLLPDKEITFIKMDIEGAEADALRGAKKVITKQKPRLAISIYHKPEDIWTIPQLILEYNPDYTLYLRHYSFSDYDTVLYAIP